MVPGEETKQVEDAVMDSSNGSAKSAPLAIEAAGEPVGEIQVQIGPQFLAIQRASLLVAEQGF
jgi:hypothetical protein